MFFPSNGLKISISVSADFVVSSCKEVQRKTVVKLDDNRLILVLLLFKALFYLHLKSTCSALTFVDLIR